MLRTMHIKQKETNELRLWSEYNVLRDKKKTCRIHCKNNSSSWKQLNKNLKLKHHKQKHCLVAIVLVWKRVYLSSANHGQASLQQASKLYEHVVLPGKTHVSVCQPKLPSKKHEVALYLCARLYFATKDSFGFSGQLLCLTKRNPYRDRR